MLLNGRKRIHKHFQALARFQTAKVNQPPEALRMGDGSLWHICTWQKRPLCCAHIASRRQLPAVVAHPICHILAERQHVVAVLGAVALAKVAYQMLKPAGELLHCATNPVCAAVQHSGRDGCEPLLEAEPAQGVKAVRIHFLKDNHIRIIGDVLVNPAGAPHKPKAADNIRFACTVRRNFNHVDVVGGVHIYPLGAGQPLAPIGVQHHDLVVRFTAE